LTNLILNIRINSKNTNQNSRSSLIISNHLSYIDILILAVFYPTLFISSVEMKETFLLGHIAKMSGCLFVERRRSKIHPGTKENEIARMKELINNGFSLLLFPEGTTSNGDGVLPFKATFFQLAIDAQIPIVPLTIKYHGKAHEIVPWYGDMTFIDHLLKVCFLKEICVDLTQLSEINGVDKFELAQMSYNSIRGCYG